LSGVN
jgi:hypothetical protein